MNILITGATGFVGRSFITYIAERDGFYVYAVYRDSNKIPISKQRDNITWVCESEIWGEFLKKIDVIVHLAGRAHKNESTQSDKLALRESNTNLTKKLAGAATRYGVKRLVYLSTVMIFDPKESPIDENSKVAPQSFAASTKYDAETELINATQNSSTEYVIVRSPLVYGKSAPGNIGKLYKFIDGGIFMPFGAIHNSKSFISEINLCKFISLCIDHDSAVNQVFVVCDAEAISTTEFIRMLAKSIGKKVRLVSIPVWALTLFFTLIGRENQIKSLTQSLVVDCSKAKGLLGWMST